MKVKQYRANTMREALEQVKGELGDEALVLSSKNIRNRGFLGMGAKNMVEVTVSTDVVTSSAPSGSNESLPAPRQSNFADLSINTSPRTDQTSPLDRERAVSSAFSALAARAYSAESNSVSANTSDTRSSTAIVLEHSKTRDADARNSTRKAPAQGTQSATVQPDIPVVAASKRDPVITELEKLRAEVREVKFALGAFSGPRRETADPHSEPGFSEADLPIYDSPFYEAYLHLGSLGLPSHLCKAVIHAAIASAPDSRDVQEVARIGLVKALPSLVTFGSDPLAQSNIPSSSQPVVALVGPTGVGKTTTIAKLAARTALREGRRVELISLDTYRIAAIEQLRTYAEIIGAGFHVPRSILELDALIRRFSGEATIMIDTIGRSAQDLADQMELADYLRGNEEIMKCLVIQATTHSADAQIAISKFALFGIDSLLITKLDETCRPGAAIATAATAGLPLTYLCNGQRVPEDIETATVESLTDCALRINAFAMAA
jgi:flagellar biosynthesis protein FlhF